MSENSPRVLVIIVTWNKKQYVLDLLTSLSRLDYPTVAMDIMVVDNASEDGTTEAIRVNHPHVRLLYNAENLGGTGGFNRGLQWAFSQPEGQYQYYWLLDNDVLVHHQALKELIALLEKKPEVAIAGSTMMQLDFPWRINEMGAFINLEWGGLILNRHQEPIPAWQGINIENLLVEPVDLSRLLMHCPAFMDVDYVAAASLVVRAEVAKQAGLWRDYFIHFDDVEWCMRIAKMGHRVVVSAKSLIWHLSAVAKVPTWVLYYDNRNPLDLLQAHGASRADLHRIKQDIYQKAIHFYLIGKADLGQLHYQAVQDFERGQLGRKKLRLETRYQPNKELLQFLLNPRVNKVLLSFSVNVHATKIQEILVKAQLQRPELQIDCMDLPEGTHLYQLPQAQFVAFPPQRLKRWWVYWRKRGYYDLIIQSDYLPIVGLSWLNSKIIFINDQEFCLKSPPKWRDVWLAKIRWFVKKRFDLNVPF